MSIRRMPGVAGIETTKRHGIQSNKNVFCTSNRRSSRRCIRALNRTDSTRNRESPRQNNSTVVYCVSVYCASARTSGHRTPNTEHRTPATCSTQCALLISARLHTKRNPLPSTPRQHKRRIIVRATVRDKKKVVFRTGTRNVQYDWPLLPPQVTTVLRSAL